MVRLASITRRALAVAAAVACAAIVCAASSKTTTSIATGDRIASLHAIVLPDGLELPAVESAGPLASAVAADIDADGDLDLVASDGSLGLFVWTNDGSGHLSRKRPKPSTSWQGEPSSPEFDAHRTTPWVLIQNDEGPSIRSDWALRDLALDPYRLSERQSVHPAGIVLTSTRTPRAPPASLSRS